MKKIAFTLIIMALMTVMYAQELKYQLPSKEILELADYERAPSIRMDDKRQFAIYSYRSTYKTLGDLNQQEIRLAGVRINPLTRIASDMTYVNNLKIRKLSGTELTDVKGLPSNTKITYGTYSPDESKYAFVHNNMEGIGLFVINIATGTCIQISKYNLNSMIGSPFTWINNDKILIRTIPSSTTPLIDVKKDLPTGPTVSVSEGKASQNRTFPDLLKSPADESNFENLMQSELKVVDLKGKETILIKGSNMYAGNNVSPDGKYILVTTIKKPFSYIVPMSRFPMTATVYDLNGKIVKLVNEVPLTEIMPKGFSSTRKGKRSMTWRSDKASTLYYVEAQDEGDQAKKTEYRDALYSWDAPFNIEPSLLIKTKQRFSGITWGNDNTAIVEDNWYDTRNTKAYKINPSNTSIEPNILWDRNYQDIYTDPGSFETERNQYGRYVLAVENNNAFMIGEGHTAKGQFPFISKMNLATNTITKLYTCTFSDKKESIQSIVDFKKGTALVMIESATEYPNYYYRDLTTNKLTQLSDFKNPFKSIEKVQKTVLKYTRNDGLPLSGTLYLPEGHTSNSAKKLPLLIWAYPEEFKDRNSAGQNNKNANEFTYPNYGSFVYWVNKGYAVLDDASFPIIGEGKTEPNDNFKDQLVANAKAAIDAVDSLGVIDRTKCAVGGHSYGAFMTANLLTHSKLFACGVARSGAYNRTLTPFGFQSEQRNYWDVPEIYNGMSPFVTADKMKTPLLLIHGEADNNPGTFTLQTERYFQALKGLGAPVRMVILPKEQHGYAAKENIFHLLWEQDQFFEKYLK